MDLKAEYPSPKTKYTIPYTSIIPAAESHVSLNPIVSLSKLPYISPQTDPSPCMLLNKAALILLS